MATGNLDINLGRWSIIDKRATGIAGTSTSPISATTYAAMRDMAAVDTALNTANATYWTQARLDQTCLSDKVMALRQLNDAAGIS
jgi:hypothetical protein